MSKQTIDRLVKIQQAVKALADQVKDFDAAAMLSQPEKDKFAGIVRTTSHLVVLTGTSTAPPAETPDS
jgi:hypothetical protein